MNLLLFNLRTDANDGVLGFTTAWINALAKHFEHITVITMYAGRIDVAPNVTVLSLGKEQGHSEIRRLLEFYRLVLRSLRKRRTDVAFAHMAPLFALLFAPIAKLRRIRVVLWYSHKSTPLTLRLAHAVVDRCVASTSDGFRIPSKKVVFIGQGIDTAVFHPPDSPSPNYERTVLSIGRLAQIKNVHEIVEAVAVARQSGAALELRVTGGPLTPADHSYAASLRRLAEERLAGGVVFDGPVPFWDIAKQYHRGGLFASRSDSGSLDKAILESMASGCIPICTNDAFRRLATDHGLQELVPQGDPRSVAECLVKVSALHPAEKDELRSRLRTIVVQEHSLERLVERIVMVIAETGEVAARNSTASGKDRPQHAP